MTDLRKAAEDLLEGVEAAIKAGDWKVDGACDPDSAIVRLRQALAQPVDAVNMSQERVDETAKREHEPVAWVYVNTDGECEQIEYGEPFDDPSVTPLYTAPHRNCDNCESLRRAAWDRINELEAKLAEREWVGLTDDERSYYLQAAANVGWWQAAVLVENKLKEKNGG